jgi:sugar lactone lactonase YvrE
MPLGQKVPHVTFGVCLPEESRCRPANWESAEREDAVMEERRSRRAGRAWRILPITLVALAIQSVGTSAAAQVLGRCGGPGCPSEFPAFIPMWGLNVTPSGLAVDRGGNIYVSIRDGVAPDQLGKIWKYAPTGNQSLFAEVGNAEIYGLAVAAHGDVYAAMARFGTDTGVYRVDREGHVELLPGSDQIVFANALAFDGWGTLYVTESYSGTPPSYGPGGIWRIARGGQAELWIRDPLLTGVNVVGYPVGANGIAFHRGYLYVTNTCPARVLRIPVLPDGSAGTIEVWATLVEVPESPLAGSPVPVMADDVRLDVHGNVYVALVSRAAVVRISALDKSQKTLAAFQAVPHGSVPWAPLDFSASIAFGTCWGGRQSLFVTNLGLGPKFPWPPSVPKFPWPGPGLAKIDAGMPERPHR